MTAVGAPARSRGRYRVLVVDDHDLAREGIAELVTRGGMEVVAAAVDAQSARAALPFLTVDVIVSDFRMPGQTGADLADELREAGIETPVLLITAFLDDDVLDACASSAARGVVTKVGVDAPTLARAIHAVASGQSVVDARIADRIVVEGAALVGRNTILTSRETEALRRAAGGASVEETAHAMGLSVDGVKTLRKRAYRKLGASNGADAAARAVRLGLI